MAFIPRFFLSGLFLVGGLSACALTGLALGENQGHASFSFWLNHVEEGHRLEALDHAVQRCSTAKVAVTADLVAGRLTLPAAAEQFRLLEESAAEAGVPSIFWKAGDEYDRLISWVETHLPDLRGDRAEVRARLTAQWGQRFGNRRDLPSFLAGTHERAG